MSRPIVRCPTLRSSRPTTAGFARFRGRLSLNVSRSQMETLHQLDAGVSALRDPVLIAIATVFCFEGARLLTEGVAHRRALIMFVPATALLVLLGSFSFWLSHSAKLANEKLVLPAIAGLPSTWGSTQTPEQREQNSRAFASVMFVGSGTVVKYYDQVTGWQPYAPTLEDLAMRERAILTIAATAQASRTAYFNGIASLLAGAISAALGFYIGRKKINYAG